MLDILKPLLRRAAPRRAQPAASELWSIDLGPVDEPMMNGRTERISLTTSERISLGKGKREPPKPIGRSAERDFDWQSVDHSPRRRSAVAAA